VAKLKFKALSSHSEICGQIKNPKLDRGKDISILNCSACVQAGGGDYARIFKKCNKYENMPSMKAKN
jgi:hypothetical protein